MKIHLYLTSKSSGEDSSARRRWIRILASAWIVTLVGFAAALFFFAHRESIDDTLLVFPAVVVGLVVFGAVQLAIWVEMVRHLAMKLVPLLILLIWPKAFILVAGLMPTLYLLAVTYLVLGGHVRPEERKRSD